MAFHRGRGHAASSGRPARSGIRTRGGQYRKFDSQRIQKQPSADSDDDQSSEESEQLEIESESEVEDDDDEARKTAYSLLLENLASDELRQSSRPAKRRKIDVEDKVLPDAGALLSESPPPSEADDAVESVDGDGSIVEEDDQISLSDGDENETINAASDPYDVHFEQSDEGQLSKSIHEIDKNEIQQKRSKAGKLVVTTSTPAAAKPLVMESDTSLAIKQKLRQKSQDIISKLQPTHKNVLPLIANYSDVLYGGRTPAIANGLRQIVSVHVTNHILKGRDKILKNNSRLAQSKDDSMLDIRDQGFTRPKILILTETRQMCSQYAQAIANLFDPDQQENRQRFVDSFTAPVDERDMPGDYRELFDGNNDNNFITTIKFTRKTLKYFAAFYQSDIILASPLGLRRIIEHEDKRKKDHDFLSSIEVLVIDQADAMQMQNWENIETVLQHLNLQPKQLRDCDVNRVRHWYLDNQAQYLRQNIVFSAYITPELNKFFNTTMKNIAGKVKLLPEYPGSIQSITGYGIKQTFSRFSTTSPLEDPQARFKYFTTAILPQLVRSRSGREGAGVLIYVPSYFDFLRIRNFFATSTMTENVSFGAIHDYSEHSEQRRARSHFLAGKYSFLLYTQRAHHFFRLRIRGVKKVVMYGLPENNIFYNELVAGYIGSTLEEGRADATETGVRCLFSKFDALKLERIVGSSRVKNMLTGSGDTFDFV